MTRLTTDDLLNAGRSTEFEIDQKAQVRVIKKKAPKPELYASETELKKCANDLLSKLPRCKLLKTDNMALKVGSGRKAKTRNPGLSDHHLCMNGFFVAIEAKLPGKDLDPAQKIYQSDILKAGGIFILYHSLHELVQELKKYRLIPKNFEV